jgi:hypothetical protein
VLKPIIIVGAGRSGTKMLRSILTAHPDVVCFPREINYIWRYGNANADTDELKPEHARPEVIQYIRSQFSQFRKKRNSEIIVEKTCANSLRVDFVHTIFPKAQIIHLVRDGRAVAESARRCWKARPKIRYILEKAIHVPIRDIPYYGSRYLRYQLGRLNMGDAKQSSWGPRFAQLDELVKEKTLIEVCGIQWKVCVQAAEAAMKDLPSDQTITLRYEDIINSSLSTIGRLFEKINLPFTTECQVYVRRTVTKEHINKWQHDLSGQDMRMLIPHIESELLQHEYEI